jgi:hypothetical protein
MRAPLRLLPSLLVVAALLPVRPASAHEHMYVGATAKRGGTLVLQYDFARAFPVVPLPGTNKDLGTDPAFGALVNDDPAAGIFRLRAGTRVSMVIASMDPEVTVIFNGKTLKKPGDRQLIGRAPYLHQHPQWYLTVPPGVVGAYHLSFKVVAAGYKPSAVYAATLSNDTGTTTTIPSGGTTTTTLPDPCPPLGTADATVFFCRLDLVPSALDAVSPGTIAGRRALARLYRTITTVRSGVQSAMTDGGPKATRLMTRADKRLSRFITDVDAGVRRNQIASDAADRVRTLASAAYDALTLLRTAPGATP